MEVFVNSESIQLEANASITTLLQQLQMAGKKGMAVALNNKVIPAHKQEQTRLTNQDKITIIRAAQGG